MNILSKQLVRNFMIKPLLKSVLHNRFDTGDIIRGRIIQALPKKNLFVLQTRGMNLVANTRLSLFVGDRISGQIINIKDQIELKLIDVNGKYVQQNMSISENGLAFARIPLSENVFGKETYLEIYSDNELKKHNENSEEVESYNLILDSKDLQNIIINTKLNNSELILIVWIENEKLYQFIQNSSANIEQNLFDENIKKVNFKVRPLVVDVSYFRKIWTENLNFDIRA